MRYGSLIGAVLLSGVLILGLTGASAGTPQAGVGPTPTPTPTDAASPTPTPSPTPSLEPLYVRSAWDGLATAATSGFAWTYAPRDRRLKTRVLFRGSDGKARRISKRGVIAHTGGLFGGKLVYQEKDGVYSGDANLRLYDVQRGRHRKLPDGVNSKHYDWAPVVWGRWLAYTRHIGNDR